MRNRSKKSKPAAEVLDPAVVRDLAAAMRPAELAQADRDAMHGRIMQRVGDEVRRTLPARTRRC